MNKFSKYNHFIENGDNCLLYNIARDEVLILQPQLADLIQQHLQDVDRIGEIHPPLYHELKKKGYIVPQTSDEVKELISRWEKEDHDDTQFTIMINPTLECNLKCWYCYEKHEKGTFMSDEIITRLKKFIYRLTHNGKLKDLHLSFFGGEPFMKFHYISWPILSYAKTMCDEQHINLSLHFTTNGTIISEPILRLLKSLNCSIQFQITIDGSKVHHDQSRKSLSGNPTFALVVKHIKQLLKDHYPVNCRLNYTANTIYSFAEISKDFEALNQEERQYLTFTFQQIWQDQEHHSLSKDEMKVIDWLKEQGFVTNLPSKYISRRCYADFDNQVLVNYNGSLYKCTARDFKPDNQEGLLNEDGDLVYNSIYRQRMSEKYGNEYCQQCMIYPLCHGGCSQSIMEHGGGADNVCMFGYTEEDKHTLVRERLKHQLITLNHL